MNLNEKILHDVENKVTEKIAVITNTAPLKSIWSKLAPIGREAMQPAMTGGLVGSGLGAIGGFMSPGGQTNVGILGNVNESAPGFGDRLSGAISGAVGGGLLGAGVGAGSTAWKNKSNIVGALSGEATEQAGKAVNKGVAPATSGTSKGIRGIDAEAPKTNSAPKVNPKAQQAGKNVGVAPEKPATEVAKEKADLEKKRMKAQQQSDKKLKAEAERADKANIKAVENERRNLSKSITERMTVDPQLSHAVNNFLNQKGMGSIEQVMASGNPEDIKMLQDYLNKSMSFGRWVGNRLRGGIQGTKNTLKRVESLADDVSGIRNINNTGNTPGSFGS